jgi:2'-5' RNA ligase
MSTDAGPPARTPVDAHTHRLFFALWPDPQARAALALLARDVARHALGNAPRADNLHLTLAFLGSVGGDRLEPLRRIGGEVAARVAPFDLSLERIGGRGFGIAWLSPDGLPPALVALHGTLTTGLAGDGFAAERRMFRPHLTLARHCVRAAHRGAVLPIRWTVDRLALVESTLAAGGSRYRDLASWPLGGAPSLAAR